MALGALQPMVTWRCGLCAGKKQQELKRIGKVKRVKREVKREIEQADTRREERKGKSQWIAS